PIATGGRERRSIRIWSSVLRVAQRPPADLNVLYFRTVMRGSTCVVVPAMLLMFGSQERATPPRDAQIEALVMEASAAPPEFAADVLIRASASPRILDSGWKRELLETAFMRAYG